MQFTAQVISSITLAATLASAFVVPRQTAAGNYTLTFSNQTGAVQGTDFITFGLFATTPECTAFCDSVVGCKFANSYHDNNGKGGSPLLTCSLYESCYNTSFLTNIGGQEQGNGTVNFITDSDGWCKDTATSPTTTAPPEPTTTVPTEPTTTVPTEPTTTAPTEPTTTAPTEPTTTAPTEPTTTAPTEPTTTAPTEPTTTAPVEPTEPADTTTAPSTSETGI